MLVHSGLSCPISLPLAMTRSTGWPWRASATASSESAVPAPPVPGRPSNSLATTATRLCSAPEVAVLADTIRNIVGGERREARSGATFQKLRPDDGSLLCLAPRSGRDEVAEAVEAARLAHTGWAARTPVERGELVREIALALR